MLSARRVFQLIDIGAPNRNGILKLIIFPKPRSRFAKVSIREYHNSQPSLNHHDRMPTPIQPLKRREGNPTCSQLSLLDWTTSRWKVCVLFTCSLGAKAVTTSTYPINLRELTSIQLWPRSREVISINLVDHDRPYERPCMCLFSW